MKLLLYVVSTGLITACTGASGNNQSGKENNSALTGSGGDLYYEYKLTTSGKELQMTGSTKMYLSSSGKARVEMLMAKNIAGDKPVTFVLLGSYDKPNQSIILDDETKTYSINHINRDSLGIAEKIQSSVTKVGEDKILGFNCVHAKIISQKDIGGLLKITDTIDIWKSNEVPMTDQFKKLMYQFESKTGNYMYSGETNEQLKKMGCDGFMVKIVIGSKRTHMTQELVKMEHKEFPALMFEIPSGYKEDKNGSL